VVKFGLYPAKLKKNPFLANNFKIQGGPWPPSAPPFRRPWRHSERFRRYWNCFS